MMTIRAFVRHPDHPGQRFLCVLRADERLAESCLLGPRRYYQRYAEEQLRQHLRVPREWEFAWEDWRETTDGAMGFGYLRPIENGKPTRDEELWR